MTNFAENAHYTLTGAQLDLLLKRHHNVCLDKFALRIYTPDQPDPQWIEDNQLYDALIAAIRERGVLDANEV
ncbi:hypothetical protein PQ472_07930 [Lacticaseibacillus pabuli]|uniref:Uncharacterized protein n=1 Tax=Lacticaseibacillus pabuli TaxID=3025672 RepID=A0ABY7WNW5_9LACO|nr:hypothetical protein [Lacticaseibacillus sp. KACC 23028]WDF81854.1 hypothetical protein PQ472_07930 [Lacticaseibacillus sp. KACC 23028]